MVSPQPSKNSQTILHSWRQQRRPDVSRRWPAIIRDSSLSDCSRSGMTFFSDEAPPQPARPQPRGLKRKFGWGLLDQVASSGTNFGLSLFGGRLLGASGLGVIAIGFSAYLIVLGLQRALLSEPLIIVSSVQEYEVRRKGTRSSISATVGFGVAAACVVGLLGLWIGGDVGKGLTHLLRHGSSPLCSKISGGRFFSGTREGPRRLRTTRCGSSPCPPA